MNLNILWSNADEKSHSSADSSFIVERMSWAEPGGPESAVFSLPLTSLAGSSAWFNLLRRGVTVLASGVPCWWGYVSAVRLICGQLTLTSSMEDVASRVRVRYRRTSAGLEGAEPLIRTGWVEDGVSRGIWGRKERVIDIGAASDSHAGLAHARWLDRLRCPQVRAGRDPSADADELRLEVQARGWWQTLDWVYADLPDGLEGTSSAGDALLTLGTPSGPARLLQTFTPASNWALDEIWLRVGKNGTPADDLCLDLHTWDGQTPGPRLASARRAAAGLPSGLTWAGWSFDPPLPLTAGQPVCLVLSCSGAPDALNAWRAALDESCSYPRGVLRVEQNGVWLARVPDADLCFRAAGGVETTGQIARLAGSDLGGGFLHGVHIGVSSGIRTPLWRGGQQTCLAEILDLLSAGTADGGSLCAAINAARWLDVRALPPPAQARLLLTADGCLRTIAGRELRLDEPAVGQWAYANGVPVYLHRAEWSLAGGR